MANEPQRKKSTKSASNTTAKARSTSARAAAERALLFPPPEKSGRGGKTTRTGKRTSKSAETRRKTAATKRPANTAETKRNPQLAQAPSQTSKALATATTEPADSFLKRLTGLPGAMAGGAFRLAIRTTEVPLKVAKGFLKPEQAEMMEEAGQTLKDLREVAGLTRDELSDALNLKDRSLLEAIENGTAIMSFELIMRLAAVLARHDPLPVVLKFTRTYNPELWKLFESWGFGRMSLNFEREREFINIYRRHDAARLLSDEEFAKVLDFTRAAFDMGLQFAIDQKAEKQTPSINKPSSAAKKESSE